MNGVIILLAGLATFGLVGAVAFESKVQVADAFEGGITDSVTLSS